MRSTFLPLLWITSWALACSWGPTPNTDRPSPEPTKHRKGTSKKTKSKEKATARRPAPEKAPVKTGPLDLTYTEPTELMNAGTCRGVVPQSLLGPLARLNLTAEDLDKGVPCARGDYNRDGVPDYALAEEEARVCRYHVEVNLLVVMGPDGAKVEHVADPEASGCMRPGTYKDQPAIEYLGEGSGDWAAVWDGKKMTVVLAAAGD